MRGGVVNPLMRLPRSNLLTVGYRIRNGYLERLGAADGRSGQCGADNTKTFPGGFAPFAFHDGTRWLEDWSSQQTIPAAVRMILHSPQWGEIERIWLLRGPQLS